MASRYKGITKNQIIKVIEGVMQQLEAIEITVNILVAFVDKDNKFDSFMKEKLGGINEAQRDVSVDREEDSSDNKENT